MRRLEPRPATRRCAHRPARCGRRREARPAVRRWAEEPRQLALRALLSAALLLPASLLLPARAGAAERHALLIGLNEYQNVREGIVPLKFAVNDVTALGDALRARGFQVRSLLNRDAEREDILIELYRYAELLDPDDTFVLFFAGHGVRNTGINDKGYWLTSDARLGLLDGDGIRLEHLLDYVRDLRAAQKLVLLDHCFAGDLVTAASGGGGGGIDVTAGGGGGARDANTSLSLARGMLSTSSIAQQIEGRVGSLVIVAAASGAAFESEQVEHGLFTEALLQGLNSRSASGDDVLKVSELVAFLESEVIQLAQQHGFQQEVRTFTEEGMVPTWELATALPVDSLASMRTRQQILEQILTRWQLRGWITPSVKFDVLEVLQKWVAAAEGGPSLSEVELLVVHQVELHAEGTTPEDIRARALQRVIDEIRGGPP